MICERMCWERGCACDSPAWCTKYKKCNREMLGLPKAEPVQEPVACQDSDDRRLLHEIFMLCEATEEIEATNDFMRGRGVRGSSEGLQNGASTRASIDSGSNRSSYYGVEMTALDTQVGGSHYLLIELENQSSDATGSVV